jgi:diacylglycerol kinase family enzyme
VPRIPDEQAFEERLATLAPIDDAGRRRALLIVNPHAAHVDDRLRDLVAYALAARYEVDAVQTQWRGHATELSRDAVRDGYALVIALGGDGTVNEAANGLAGSGVPLTCLPGGSANVYCKLLGIGGEIVDATERLLLLADRFSPRAVDLGLVEGRLFTFTAGVGLDADVVRRVDARPSLKARFGPYFYAAVASEVLLRRYLLRPPRMFVAVGEETLSGVTAVIQNAEHYTYFHARALDLADGARLDDGALAGVVLRRASLLALPSLALRAALPRLRVSRHRHVRAFAGAATVTVSSAGGRSLALQADGDYLGEVSEARFSVRPRALTVVS